MKKSGLHRAWLVLIGCCAIMSGGLGIICNCIGIFYAPVSEAMGFGMGQMSMTYTIRTLSSALAVPFISKYYRKGHFKAIVTLSALGAGGSLLAMGFFHSICQWCLASAVMGAMGCVIFTSASFLINNWFQEKTGFALGMSATFSGLAGALLSPAGTWIIGQFGWRAAYIALGGLSLALMLPFCVTVLDFSPADVGLEPYGAGSGRAVKTEYEARYFSRTDETKVFALSVFLFLSIQCASSLTQHLPKMAIQAGLSASLAALILSASMIGNILGKVVLGSLYDRFGLKRITFLLQMLIGLAIFTFVFQAEIFQIDFIAGVIFGTHMSLYTLTLPLVVRAVYGSGRYSEIYPKIYAPASIVSAFSSTMVGVSYDLSGSYTIAFVTLGTLAVLGGFALLELMRQRPSTAEPQS